MSSNKSTTLSAKVEASMEDAMASFKLLKRELGSEIAQLESEDHILIQAAKDELEACSDSKDPFPDPELDRERAALNVDRKRLDAEKMQLKVDQTQLGKDKALLESEKTRLRVEQSKLKAAQSRLNDAKSHLECTQSQLDEPRQRKVEIKSLSKRVFLDIAIKGIAAGRIVIELDVKTFPKTCENFRALCTGEKGIGVSGKPLHYKGTKFNYVSSEYIMGGDNVNENGRAGESIYGLTFLRENFIRKDTDTGPGVVSMALAGPRLCRGSQFFITTGESETHDADCVPFGDVIVGMDVVTEIIKAGGGASVIADCGQLW